MKMKNNYWLSFAMILGLLFFSGWALAVTPSGATVQTTFSEGMSSSQAGNASAYAGNLTQLVIYSGRSTPQSWQGFYGNVTGSLRLADGSGNALYNWSLETPGGEVYASTNATISWANIQCFNFTAMGNYTPENGTGGNTSLYGINVTQLEDLYNIAHDDLDSVNLTFQNFNHDTFYTAGNEFLSNECRSLQMFTNNSVAEEGVFEEILLYEPESTSVVFTSLLETARKGFNGELVDFEMLVLDDGHGTNLEVTPYYLFLELE
jgi:hypothetical protein